MPTTNSGFFFSLQIKEIVRHVVVVRSSKWAIIWAPHSSLRFKSWEKGDTRRTHLRSMWHFFLSSQKKSIFSTRGVFLRVTPRCESHLSVTLSSSLFSEGFCWRGCAKDCHKYVYPPTLYTNTCSIKSSSKPVTHFRRFFHPFFVEWRQRCHTDWKLLKNVLVIQWYAS